jgi:hypothetical protein
VIAGAAICPPAPLLARELTGLDPVLPELREACTAAIKRLVRSGPELSGLGDRVGLLVMADGSACRSPRAPGYLDPRAAAFDAALEQAVRGGDLGALRAMDESVARELLASGRPAWQVLAGR